MNTSKKKSKKNVGMNGFCTIHMHTNDTDCYMWRVYANV